MRAVVSLPEVDLKRTEEFLITQEEVVDASVWLDRGEIRAHVTVTEDAVIDSHQLQAYCAAHIGPRRTPSEIILLRHRNRRN